MRSGNGNDPVMAVADTIPKALAVDDGIAKIVIMRNEARRARRLAWH